VENCGKPVETPVGSQEKFEKNIKTKDISQVSPLFFFNRFPKPPDLP
jgi:hypothetical protein